MNRVADALLRNGATRYDKRALFLGDGFGHDVGGNLDLGGAGQSLYRVGRGFVQRIDGDLRRVRIRGVQEVVIGRIEHLVKVGFFEDGFLEPETLVTQQALQEGGGVCLLFAEAAFQALLEQHAVCVEERKAYAVARELPFFLCRNRFLE